nr:hypothetical protein [Tanacetum cinerariifolium]
MNYDPKGERFLIASRFPTPPFACAFFSPGAIVTDFCCSKGNVEDKILVPKPLKNCARCAKCGHPVNGPYCQGCALLREKLEEDLCQPPQYTVNHPIFNAHNDFLNSQNELSIAQNTIKEQMIQLTSMYELVCQIFQKKQEEKRIEEEQAASARYWKIPACCDNDDDYDYAITPVLSTKETYNSLSMGDEHFDTILATKSDEVIKSSVENLVPIPSESESIPDTMCDVHLVNNPTPLEAKDYFEIVTNSNDDISSSDNDSL